MDEFVSSYKNSSARGISNSSAGSVVRSRATVHSLAPSAGTGRSSLMPPEEEDDGNDSSDSDRKSKMSFSYWGADKVTIHKPPPKPRMSSMASHST